MTINIGLVDDQLLFLRSLGALIDSSPGFRVTVDALNGEDILRKLSAQKELPDILLVDVDMPVMNGLATVEVVARQYPTIKMAALTMKDDDTTIIQMIRAGCCAYFLKDIHPDELERALGEIHRNGYYNADTYNINSRRLLSKESKDAELRLSDRERVFLQLAASDLTYKQIAAQMNLSERTIDGYRESIFVKLQVQSRVGMVLDGIRRRLVSF